MYTSIQIFFFGGGDFLENDQSEKFSKELSICQIFSNPYIFVI